MRRGHSGQTPVLVFLSVLLLFLTVDVMPLSQDAFARAEHIIQDPNAPGGGRDGKPEDWGSPNFVFQDIVNPDPSYSPRAPWIRLSLSFFKIWWM